MSFLPAPKHKYAVMHEQKAAEVAKQFKTIPDLTNRKGYKPSSVEDFGDGGAFPEIHMVQYPLNMGRPGSKSTAVVAVDVDDHGDVRYDAIVTKQGSNRDKIVQSSMADLKEKVGDKESLALPADDEEAKTAERTRLALEALLDSKIKKSKPTTLANAPNKNKEEPQYIRYTPNPNAASAAADGGGAKERVIRMVEAQTDPMEPPKHKMKKVPGGPPSPPAPVLHSPPRKLTVADQASWKIPPCISNWKNARGYTIPLDKRLAADGRGLQETTINNKFASLTEALYVVERKAAEDIRVRNQVRRQMGLKEKEDHEKELRDMAAKARMERSGVLLGGGSGAGPGSAGYVPPTDKSDYYRRTRPEDEVPQDQAARGDSVRENDYRSSRSGDAGAVSSRHRGDRDSEDIGGNAHPNETDEERMARQQREELRLERRKERERELRLENLKGGAKAVAGGAKREDGDRDISEKIALGLLRGGNAQLSGEGMFDARLFNQSSGMDSGFGAEDEYNTYSKGLFAHGDSAVASSIYRPKASDSDSYGDVDAQIAKLSDTSRFKADKGFRGTEAYANAGPRSEPVQFERSEIPSNSTGSSSRPRGVDTGDEDRVETSSKRSRHN